MVFFRLLLPVGGVHLLGFVIVQTLLVLLVFVTVVSPLVFILLVEVVVVLTGLQTSFLATLERIETHGWAI